MNRFNNAKPGMQALSTKRKVLKEFRNIQNQLHEIEQDMIMPDGEPIPGTTKESTLND